MTRNQLVRRSRSDRGGTTSVLVLLSIPALILIVGLVVDGGQKVAAAQDAVAAANAAARAGTDAAAESAVAGNPGSSAARAAAQQYLADAGINDSSVTMQGLRVHVEVAVHRPTRFLSVIGFTTVTGEGYATARLTPTGG